jgi:flavin-dependent dehydrogenase
MDDGTAAIFQRVTGYRSPESLAAIVTKYRLPPESLQAVPPYIHAYLPRHPRIEFGGITPKGEHLTINIAGKDVDEALMREFLAMPDVHRVLPGYDSEKTADFRFFKGRFPCSLARNYFGDRFVITGDAAGLVRAFKGKGVTSAVLTASRAAETALCHGISRQAFADYYISMNKDIIADFPYGRLMRFFTIHMARTRLLDPVVRAATGSPELRAALFGAVSAHDPYRYVVRSALHLRSLGKILAATRPRSPRRKDG